MGWKSLIHLDLLNVTFKNLPPKSTMCFTHLIYLHQTLCYTLGEVPSIYQLIKSMVKKEGAIHFLPLFISNTAFLLIDYKDISKQFAHKVYLNAIMLAFGQIILRN